MADISKCSGKVNSIECELKNRCYRFTAVADELYQSYFMPGADDFDPKTGCSYFWEN